MEEALAMGIARIREIFEIPIVQHEHVRNKEGEIVETKTKYDTKAANLILRAYAQVDQRIKGGFVQRHQIQTAHVSNQLKEAKSARSLEEIDEKLKLLESQDKMLNVPVYKEHPVKNFRKQTEDPDDDRF